MLPPEVGPELGTSENRIGGVGGGGGGGGGGQPPPAAIACVAGVGFTVALFFTTAAFRPGVELDQTKMGALLSFGAIVPSALLALALRVGRFAG